MLIFKPGRYYSYQVIIVIFKLEDHFCERVKADKKKKIFANDLLNTAVLEVMDDNTNALKGDKDPSEWLPPNKEYHVTYVKNWVEIKTLYGLTFDKKEIAVIEEILGSDIGL